MIRELTDAMRKAGFTVSDLSIKKEGETVSVELKGTALPKQTRQRRKKADAPAPE